LTTLSKCNGRLWMSDPEHEPDTVAASSAGTGGGRGSSGVARGAAWFGSVCLLFAGLVLVLAMIAGQGTALGLPYLWTGHRPIWYLMGVAAFVCAWSLLREPRPGREVWSPARPGIRFQRLVLYTRRGCHLCDQAKDSLLKYTDYLPPIEEIDIDRDQELQSQFGRCVPVVVCDERICFRGQVNEVLLRRLIEGTQPLE